MEVRAPPVLCHFLYRSTIDNILVKAISFHWHNDKRKLCQYSETSI